MQPMIGLDAVLLLIDHRIGLLQNDTTVDQKCVDAMITVLEDIKGQIDHIMPIHLPSDIKVVIMTKDI